MYTKKRPTELSLSSRLEDAMLKTTYFLRSISTAGGYAGIYSLDLIDRYGESLKHHLSASQIWIQPPGTPTIGEVFLRAYHITHEPEYLDAATTVGQAIVWAQKMSGGWSYTADMAGFQHGIDHTPENGPCTFDDDTTQAALRFLMHLDQVVHERWLSKSVKSGLNHMLFSQFSNGAWPQWYPLKGGYFDYYTFNDGVINTCIDVMLEAHKLYDNPRHLRSAKLGGDFIILSQFRHPQSGWAQQYSHDMEPAWARDYEPPAVCSAVTAWNIKTLIALYQYTDNYKYLRPIRAAISWTEYSKLNDEWARFYEMETNLPIYGDIDRKIHYTLEEISEERRHGYRWHGTFGIPSAVQQYEALFAFTESDLEVIRIVQEQDYRGRWVRDEKIHMEDFVKNLNLLCDYLDNTSAISTMGSLSSQSGPKPQMDAKTVGSSPNGAIVKSSSK